MEIFEICKEYIKPELLILIPVLYLIGAAIKRTCIKDELIPFILGLISIVLCLLYIFATGEINSSKDICSIIFASITQGILTAGASVYINQMAKQAKKFD